MAIPQLMLQAFKVTKRQFPGEHHPFAAQRCGLSHTGGTGDRHLGGCMQCQTRYKPSSQPAQADVLHDDGIHTGFRCSDQQLRCPLQLIGEHQHIEGETSPHLSLMQPKHHRRKIVDTEILGPLSGVEGIHTEVDRISS